MNVARCLSFWQYPTIAWIYWYFITRLTVFVFFNTLYYFNSYVCNYDHCLCRLIFLILTDWKLGIILSRQHNSWREWDRLCFLCAMYSQWNTEFHMFFWKFALIVWCIIDLLKSYILFLLVLGFANRNKFNTHLE